MVLVSPILVYYALHSLKPKGEPTHRWLWNLARLWYFRLPGWLRKVLVGWHFLLVPIVFLLPVALPALIAVEVALVLFMHSSPFSRLLFLRNTLPFLAGFVGAWHAMPLLSNTLFHNH